MITYVFILLFADAPIGVTYDAVKKSVEEHNAKYCTVDKRGKLVDQQALQDKIDNDGVKIVMYSVEAYSRTAALGKIEAFYKLVGIFGMTLSECKKPTFYRNPYLPTVYHPIATKAYIKDKTEKKTARMKEIRKERIKAVKGTHDSASRRLRYQMGYVGHTADPPPVRMMFTTEDIKRMNKQTIDYLKGKL